MKKLVLTLFGVVAFAASPGLAGDFIPLDTIDVQKVKASPWCSCVEAAFWPTEATIRTRAYTSDLITEKTALIQTLQRVMKKECLPPDSLVKQTAVGIANLRNGNDCLLLQYRTASGLDIQITAEKQLYLMVTVPEGWRKPLSEVAPLVWRTAAAVLLYPEFEGNGPQEPQFIIPGHGQPGKASEDDDSDSSIDNHRTDRRGEMGWPLSDDTPLYAAWWTEWPLVWGEPPSPPWERDNPIEHQAYQCMTVLDETNWEMDWGSPGKQHRTNHDHSN